MIVLCSAEAWLLEPMSAANLHEDGYQSSECCAVLSGRTTLLMVLLLFMPMG
jgi:hypothetical protein